MDVIKIQINKSSVINTVESTAKQLKIPFDGIVYASIGYMLDHGLHVGQFTEYFHGTATRTMYLSDFLVSIIDDRAKKMDISRELYIKYCLAQIIWLTECNEVIPEYYRKRLDNNAPKKISKTKD